MPDGVVPVEGTSRGRRLSRPEHPGGEDAVEEGLHQRGAEEGRPVLALEADSQRLLQRRAHRPERRRVACRLDPRQPVPRVGRQQPRQVPGLDQRGAMGQRPAQVLSQAGASLPGEGTLGFSSRDSNSGVDSASRKVSSFTGLTRRVLSQQYEVAGVGHEHEAVPDSSSGSPGRSRRSARRRRRLA